MLRNQSKKRVKIIKIEEIRLNKKFSFKITGKPKINSKSKIIKIIKIKKKLMENDLREVLSKFWKPLSIW